MGAPLDAALIVRRYTLNHRSNMLNWFLAKTAHQPYRLWLLLLGLAWLWLAADLREPQQGTSDRRYLFQHVLIGGSNNPYGLDTFRVEMYLRAGEQLRMDVVKDIDELNRKLEKAQDKAKLKLSLKDELPYLQVEDLGFQLSRRDPGFPVVPLTQDELYQGVEIEQPAVYQLEVYNRLAASQLIPRLELTLTQDSLSDTLSVEMMVEGALLAELRRKVKAFRERDTLETTVSLDLGARDTLVVFPADPDLELNLDLLLRPGPEGPEAFDLLQYEYEPVPLPKGGTYTVVLNQKDRFRRPVDKDTAYLARFDLYHRPYVEPPPPPPAVNYDDSLRIRDSVFAAFQAQTEAERIRQDSLAAAKRQADLDSLLSLKDSVPYAIALNKENPRIEVALYPQADIQPAHLWRRCYELDQLNAAIQGMPGEVPFFWAYYLAVGVDSLYKQKEATAITLKNAYFSISAQTKELGLEVYSLLHLYTQDMLFSAATDAGQTRFPAYLPAITAPRYPETIRYLVRPMSMAQRKAFERRGQLPDGATLRTVSLETLRLTPENSYAVQRLTPGSGDYCLCVENTNANSPLRAFFLYDWYQIEQLPRDLDPSLPQPDTLAVTP